MESLTEEKVRLLREIAQLRAATSSGSGKIDEEGGYYFTSQPTTVASTKSSVGNLVPKVSANGAISSVGALRLYEFMLGIFFVAAVINWIFV